MALLDARAATTSSTTAFDATLDSNDSLAVCVSSSAEAKIILQLLVSVEQAWLNR
jgi:hypothetical protein